MLRELLLTGTHGMLRDRWAHRRGKRQTWAERERDETLVGDGNQGEDRQALGQTVVK